MHDLLDYLRDLADHLSRGTALNWREVEGTLNSLQDLFEGIAARYQDPAPSGAEVVRELMLESVDLFMLCLDGIYDYIETKNPAELRLAVARAEEASDLLCAVEYAVEQNKEWLHQVQ